MSKKTLVFALLLIPIFLMGCSSQADSQITKESTIPVLNSEISKAEKIEVIDFHATRRCFSCQTIEKYAKATIEEFFQPELRDGKITFDSINVEESQNEDIVKKYQARGSSLFVNAIRDGKDDINEDVNVWRLVGDEESFKKYFKTKLEKLLN